MNQWHSGSARPRDGCIMHGSASGDTNSDRVNMVHGHWMHGIRSIRSQGRPAPSFCRTTRSYYKLHELYKTSDYSMYMYYYHMYHLYYWGIPSSDGIPYGLADFFFLCVCFFFSPSAAENGIPGGQTHGRKPWINLIF